jgi:superfamily II DNA or RNA helicase
MLPKLKKSYSKGIFKYKLSDTNEKRRIALSEYIFSSNEDPLIAALKKKKRLGVLRIYRRYKKPDECKTITSDMKWIDKHFLKGKTSNIC